MSSDRRSFLRNMALASGAVAAGSLLSSCGSEETLTHIKASANKKPNMRFNMSGYAAPPLDTVRIGIVGIGSRGMGSVRRITYIDGVEITALCDIRQSAVDRGQKILQEAGLPKAAEFTNGETAYKEMCQSDLVDLVYVVTSWEWHIPIAIEAMENDKHTAVEVPAAKTIDECWQIVETSERTKKHCVILENTCYDSFELLTLNMVRQGVFGDLIHGEGAYIHHVNFGVNSPKKDSTFWRLKENNVQANQYPTHGLGPICQAMNINRGDKMEYLTAMISDDFNFAKNIKKHAEKNPVLNQFVGWDMRGNMDIQLIRTNKGRTIMIQHDVTSPRPYSRIHMLSGTECFAQKYPLQHIAFGEDIADADKMKELEEKYTPEIVRRIGESSKKVGGHGGMDFLMDWRLIDCLRNGLAMDMDVYDAASWSCITSLSEWSIGNQSNSIEVPDFTRGAWKTNKRMDLSLVGGGTTGVRNLNR